MSPVEFFEDIYILTNLIRKDRDGVWGKPENWYVKQIINDIIAKYNDFHIKYKYAGRKNERI